MWVRGFGNHKWCDLTRLLYHAWFPKPHTHISYSQYFHITMSPLEGKACKYSYCVPNCALFHFLDKNRTKIGGHSIYHIHNWHRIQTREKSLIHSKIQILIETPQHWSCLVRVEKTRTISTMLTSSYD